MLYCKIYKWSGGESVPLYEYKCVKCGRRTEKIENVNGPHLKKCPHCGGKVESLISAPAIQFKGSGWYVTDYAGKSPSKEDGGKEEKSGEKSETKESKETAPKDSGKETPAKEKKTEKAAKKK
jgi:putative FmdB family regulatory protein